MKKILTVSLVAMMAISAARADIASTEYVTDQIDAEVQRANGAYAAKALETTVGDLATTVSTNKATADQTQEDLDTLEATVAGIDAAYKAADTTLTNKFGELGDQTVKAYVDTKTANIASNDTVTALGTRVTTAEGEIDALQTSLAEGGATANAIAAAKKAGTDASTALDTYKTEAASTYAPISTTYTKTEVNTALAAKEDLANKDLGEGEEAATAKYPSTKYIKDFVNDSVTGAIVSVGDVTDLTTTEKRTIVGAVNEVKATADAAVEIDQGAANKDKAVITNANGQITTGTISSGMITDNTIVNADIAANAGIEQTKIAGLADSLSAATAAALTQLADKTEDTNNDGLYTLTMKVLGDETTFKWEKIAR